MDETKEPSEPSAERKRLDFYLEELEKAADLLESGLERVRTIVENLKRPL